MSQYGSKHTRMASGHAVKPPFTSPCQRGVGRQIISSSLIPQTAPASEAATLAAVSPLPNHCQLRSRPRPDSRKVVAQCAVNNNSIHDSDGDQESSKRLQPIDRTVHNLQRLTNREGLQRTSSETCYGNHTIASLTNEQMATNQQPLKESWFVGHPDMRPFRWGSLEKAVRNYSSLDSKEGWRLVYSTNRTLEEAVRKLQGMEFVGVPQPAAIIAESGMKVYQLDASKDGKASWDYQPVLCEKMQPKHFKLFGAKLAKVVEESIQKLAQPGLAEVISTGTCCDGRMIVRVDSRARPQYLKWLEKGLRTMYLNAWVHEAYTDTHTYLDIIPALFFKDKMLEVLEVDWSRCLMLAAQAEEQAAAATAVARTKLEVEHIAAVSTASVASLGTAPSSTTKPPAAATPDIASSGTKASRPYTRPLILQAAFTCADLWLAAKKAAVVIDAKVAEINQKLTERKEASTSQPMPLPVLAAATFAITVQVLATAIDDMRATM